LPYRLLQVGAIFANVATGDTVGMIA